MNRIVVITSAVLLLTPGLAKAAEDSMIVRLGDLNVASEAGAQSALRRIRLAADRFCGGHGDRSMRVQMAVGACRGEMVDKAVAQLDDPTVTALHRGETAIRLARR
ncbi:UrcA family protein [Phenylobacterium terrae]|uniref:UrcA family protein n=1 Tax=Phenylobacterium terrae TaxID=2665495 RepID=A0ABW4MZL6_9CAUL